MTFDEKERLARIRDSSKEAAGLRLKAARLFTGLSQEQFGLKAGVGKAAINNAEKARAFPGRDAMIYLHREHRIDFNFLIVGEFVQLPQDVQDRLFENLVIASNEPGQISSSD